MNRTVLNVMQGSAEWLAARAACHGTASEAAAMMGKHKYMSRTELLEQRKTGITKEVDAAKQALFNRGHEAEAKARPLAEKIIGEELSPTTIVLEVEGLKLLASLDGITFGDDVDFEHKLYSESLAEQVRSETLEEHYTIQMDQELLVSGAEKCLFMTSDGTEENCVWMWYRSTPEKQAALIAGWKQFHKDLADYVPREIKEAPKAEVVIELPALFVHAVGEITQSNMKEFGAALAARLEEVRAIELVTDQDFANAKGAAKMFRDQIIKLKATKEAMLSQTVTIGEASRMIDAWSEDLRVTALQLEKDVEREDLAKKRAMVTAADYAFVEHMKALEAEVKPIRLVIAEPNFAEAIKGKRNYASMQDAVDTLLSQAKASADQAAQDVRNKLAWCKTNAEGYGFLFADLQQIIFKPAEDFQLLIISRIEQHKKDEAAKLEAERERIRQEEEIKARAAAAEEQAKREAAEQAAKLEQLKQTASTPASQTVQQAAFEVTTTGIALVSTSANDEGVSQSVIPTKEVVDDGSTMKLGDIAKLLGFSLTEQFIEELGIKPTGRERNAVLYRCADFPAICERLIANINAASVDFHEQRKAA
jgi:predicted phage-related endonuclease